MNSLQSTNSQYRTWLNKGVHLLKNLKDHYKIASTRQKQKLLELKMF